MSNASRLLLSFASVIAFVSNASNVSGQTAYLVQAEEKEDSAALNKPISLTLDHVPLADAFERIAAASGVTLAFSPSQAEGYHGKVSCDCEATKVRRAVDSILASTPFRYMEVRGQIVIFAKPETRSSLAAPSVQLATSPARSIVARVQPSPPTVKTSPARQGTVAGRVTELETGRPIRAARVVIPGTTFGALTDAEGRFAIHDVPPGDVEVQVQVIGYVTASQTVSVASGTTVTLDFELAQDPLALEEIVVIGYGESSHRDLTGSVTSVRAEQLNTIARSSVNQMLQGRVPGLNMTTRSAQPGGGVTVNIRGALSSGDEEGNRPLYVIDGVPMTNSNSTVPGLANNDLGFGGGIDRDPLSFLNPSDIESITVLKDASAAAIYGSSAANGVILINTRRGRAGDLQINYRGSYGIQQPKEYFPLLNGRQFMEEQSRLSFDWYLHEHGLAPYGTNTEAPVPFSPMFSEQDIAGAGAGTDWVDRVTRAGAIQEHTISLSGGTDRTRVYGSFSVHDNNAILRNSTYTRYTGRVNLDQTVSDDIAFHLRMSLGQQDGKNATSGESDGGAEKFHMIEAATRFSPTIPVFNADGGFGQHFNPLIMNPVSFLDIKDESRTNNLFVAPSLDINITRNLQATFTGQVDRESTTRGFFLPQTSNHALLAEGMAQKLEGTRNNYASEAFATYSRAFASSDLTVMGGLGIYRTDSSGFNIEAVGFFTDGFEDNNISIAEDLERGTFDSFRNEQTKLSQFMRINYSLRDRYILTLVGRRDGSSIFAENHQWGFFPGASAAWLLSEEGFLRDVDAVSELKLRVGYGQSGNETVLAGNTLQLYTPGRGFVVGNTLSSGVALDQIANPDLTWETVTTFNAGIDFGLFDNRIRGSLDAYRRTATDRLAFNPLPFNSAVDNVADNVGSTRGHGVELSLSTTNVTTAAFEWATDFNVSWSKARWVERNPRVPLNPWVGERDELGTIYGVRTDGIIRSHEEIPAHQPDANLGNVRYADTNGDGVLNNDDIIPLGNEIPRWSLGLRNDFRFGNLSLSVYAYGNLDYLRDDTYAPDPGLLRVQGVPDNTTTRVSEVWSHDNPDGWRPGVAPDPHAGALDEDTDFDLYDASFLRIGDVTLGYNLPTGLLTRAGRVRDARLFVSMQNIGVLTSYPGYDPEFTEDNPYPQHIRSPSEWRLGSDAPDSLPDGRRQQ